MGNDMFLVHKRQLAADLNEPHIAMSLEFLFINDIVCKLVLSMNLAV